VRVGRTVLAAFTAAAAGSLATAPLAASEKELLSPITEQSASGAQVPSAWKPTPLPGQSAPMTGFRAARTDGDDMLEVKAEASYGNLVHLLPKSDGESAARGATLSWRWRLAEANPAINLSSRDGDDTNLKVCVLFDLPLAAVPLSERFLLQIARNRTGEALPAATICYVWDSHEARDSVRDNAYSRRVRYWVLRGRGDPTGAWQREEREISADFRRLFGKESATVPPIIAVAVGADADNTGGRSLGFVNRMSLRLKPLDR
jgi:hypothetical protein